MAHAFVMDFAGGTLDQYDEVISRMGFTPNGAGAPGALFHWAAKSDDGLRVVDVWETPEAFNNFADTQIGPITAAVGIEPPVVTAYEVHNTLTAP